MIPILKPAFAEVVRLVLEDEASGEVAFEVEDRFVGCGVNGIAVWGSEGETLDGDDGNRGAD